MLRVEVLEEEPPARDERAPSGPDDPSGVAAPDPAGRARRRRLLRGLVASVAVVAVLLAVMAVAGQRDQRRADRLAATPGMLRPLDVQPEVRWSVRGQEVSQVVGAGGALVVVGREGGRWTLAAHRPGSGERIWSVPVVDAAGSGEDGGAIRCPSDGPDVGDLLVCLVWPPVSLHDVGPGTRPYALAVDAADGSTVARWAVEGEIVDAEPLDGDLALATADDDGIVEIRRVDGATGETRWTYTTPYALRDRLIFGGRISLRVTPDLVAVDGSGVAVLDAATGEARYVAHRGALAAVALLPDGFATWTPWRAMLRDLDGTGRATLPVLPATPVVDDGGDPDVLVLDEGTDVVALDAETSEERWRVPSGLDVTARQGGMLLLAGPDRLVAVDLRTGERRWAADELVRPSGTLGDGTVVVLPQAGRSSSTVDGLVGYDLRDGTRRWSLELPAGVEEVRAVAGYLVVRTADEVTLLH